MNIKATSSWKYKMLFHCHTWYLSFFLHEQNFWRIKFTPKKGVNYDKIHRKLPILCVITAKYTVNCQFRVKSVKIYTSQKNLHWRRRPRRRQLSGMLSLPFDLFAADLYFGFSLLFASNRDGGEIIWTKSNLHKWWQKVLFQRICSYDWLRSGPVKQPSRSVSNLHAQV